MRSYDVLAESVAPPTVVWASLLDPRTWPAWAGVGELDVSSSEGLSTDGRDKVGVIRAFRSGRTLVRERITGLTQGRRFAYETVESPQLADHQATIDLHEIPGGGTRIRWQGTYSVRGLGLRSSERQVQRAMMKTAEALAEYAAGRIVR
ncbi:SRPBCC family protein [Amycolatopsis keratiniphila]|uniref:MxaD family protein n=1 Tax=Amycolatopsis keratiniphila subsp. keratiniphila TaxID=227715 RepID=A0A1W2LY70_9PSEU|nr:SRPBCC family protein [Amycolatopsis keratiniphila]ONF72165.1 MxaD family protein [Amycolatopsis keratiniphila subsp. keratiniphila]